MLGFLLVIILPEPSFCLLNAAFDTSSRCLVGAEGGGSLSYDLMYVRHGKTTGNTEPRVYQGYVDEPSNALNEVGLQQAEDAADKVPPSSARGRRGAGLGLHRIFRRAVACR